MNYGGDVFTSDDVNTSFHAFSAILWYHFNTVFPLIKSVEKNKPKNTCITKEYLSPGTECVFLID
jgi:hypothetical protein